MPVSCFVPGELRVWKCGRYSGVWDVRAEALTFRDRNNFSALQIARHTLFYSVPPESCSTVLFFSSSHSVPLHPGHTERLSAHRRNLHVRVCSRTSFPHSRTPELALHSTDPSIHNWEDCGRIWGFSCCRGDLSCPLLSRLSRSRHSE